MAVIPKSLPSAAELTKLVKKPAAKQLGALADQIYDLEAVAAQLSTATDATRKAASELKEKLHDAMKASKQNTAGGKRGRAERVTVDFVAVTDWDRFYSHIRKTGQFELLQRRPSNNAIKERWENGKTVPGITKDSAVQVKIYKVRGG